MEKDWDRASKGNIFLWLEKKIEQKGERKSEQEGWRGRNWKRARVIQAPPPNLPPQPFLYSTFSAGCFLALHDFDPSVWRITTRWRVPAAAEADNDNSYDDNNNNQLPMSLLPGLSLTWQDYQLHLHAMWRCCGSLGSVCRTNGQCALYVCISVFNSVAMQLFYRPSCRVSSQFWQLDQL